MGRLFWSEWSGKASEEVTSKLRPAGYGEVSPRSWGELQGEASAGQSPRGEPQGCARNWPVHTTGAS